MIRALAAITALVMIASACGTDTEPAATTVAAVSTTTPATDAVASDVAATVDGVAISVGDLEAHALPGALAADLAQALRRLIINQVLEDAVIDLGIDVTDADMDATRERVIDDVTQAGAVPLEEVMAATSLTAAGFELIVRQSTLAEAIDSFLVENAPPPRDEDLQQLYDDVAAERVVVCSAHILLETEAEAIDARDRALAGEDFGDLARQLSTGPSGPSGGELGCENPTVFVPSFAEATLAAEVGVAHGPVQTQFGFHVILVTDRQQPTLDDLRPELTAQLVGEVFPVWLTAQVQAANVVVDPAYGTWTLDPSPGVIPPS